MVGESALGPRREVLGGMLGAGVLTATAACANAWQGGERAGSLDHCRHALCPRAAGVHPGSLPEIPRLSAGTDMVPQIEHIVVVMQENHSFDNYIRMLRRGDGFTSTVMVDRINSNPEPERRLRPGVSTKPYNVNFWG